MVCKATQILMTTWARLAVQLVDDDRANLGEVIHADVIFSGQTAGFQQGNRIQALWGMKQAR